MENNKVSKKKTVLVIVVSVAVVLFLGLGVAAFALKGASLRFEPEPDYKDRVYSCGTCAFFDGNTFYSRHLGVIRASDSNGHARPFSLYRHRSVNGYCRNRFFINDSYAIYYKKDLHVLSRKDKSEIEIPVNSLTSFFVYRDNILINDYGVGLRHFSINGELLETVYQGVVCTTSSFGDGKLLYCTEEGEFFVYDIDKKESTPFVINGLKKPESMFLQPIRFVSDGEHIVLADYYTEAGPEMKILRYHVPTGETTVVMDFKGNTSVKYGQTVFTKDKFYFMFTSISLSQGKENSNDPDSLCGLWECSLTGDPNPQKILLEYEPAELVVVNDAVVAVDKTGRIVYDGVAAKQE